MSVAPPPNLGLINGIPAHQMLEGLGNLHQSVVVTNTDGVVLWASHALERAVGGSDRCVGLALAVLCDRYLGVENDAVRAANDNAAAQSSEAPRLAHEIAEILRHLEDRESLCHYRIEPNLLEGHSTGLEINAFCVDSCAPGPERAVPPRTVRLYVTILRPAPKLAAGDEPRNDPCAFFESVLDQLPEATLTIDQSGFITYVNARVVALLGKTRDELMDAPLSLYFPSSAILPINASLNRGSELIERNVVELAPSSQPTIFVEVASRKLDLPDGTNTGHIVQLRDTTNQQRMTERFKQKIASLESYVHTVSHDLRSPLVSLLGFTRLMKQDYGKILDETGRRFLNRIEQAGANMNTMTRDLLEISIREAPCTTATAVDPRDILLQIQTELKPRLEEQGVRLELPSSPPMIQCDRTQLYQIFSNLIGNALQHMGPCERPRIKIEINTGTDQQIIVVRDNGRGIAAHAHERIFDAFHALSRDDGGSSSGVGLAIVKKIALAHRGRIWVDSEPGHGAAFFVSLAHVSPEHP